MAYINNDWLLYGYERTVLIKRIETLLNQINQEYFSSGTTRKTLFVTDNSDYVTVKGQGMIPTNYDVHKLSGALENFHEVCKSRGYSSWKGQSGLFWNYLGDCRYAPQENQRKRIDNRLITEAKYQELFSEENPLLSFSSLRKIIAGYYPVIVDEKDGHYYYYHIEWIRQCSVNQIKAICPLKLLIPSIFSVIW